MLTSPRPKLCWLTPAAPCSMASRIRLRPMPPENLERRGVQLRLETRVKEVHPGHVALSDGSRIDTRTVIWAGGLKASSLSESLGIKTGYGWAHRRCA